MHPVHPLFVALLLWLTDLSTELSDILTLRSSENFYIFLCPVLIPKKRDFLYCIFAAYRLFMNSAMLINSLSF